VRDRKELKRALAEGAKLDPRSDAERAYLRGLRLAQAGDPNAARRLWQAVVAAFGQEPSEARWVELSRAGLEALKRPEHVAARFPPNGPAFAAAPARAKPLASAGKTADAAAIFRALEEIARDDASALEAIRVAREGK